MIVGLLWWQSGSRLGFVVRRILSPNQIPRPLRALYMNAKNGRVL